MIFDNHSHTVFSSDSEMKVEDALKAAEKLGLGLAFTEHYDYDYLDSIHYNGMSFRFNAQDYWEAYQPYRGDRLRLGVEVGLSDTSKEGNEAFLAGTSWDIILGSVHMLDMLDLYYPDFYKDKSKEEAYGRYLETMAQMVRENRYIDVLAHIDYVCRYTDYEIKDIQYSVFHEAIDEVLKAVIDTGVVMELNTRRLGDKMALKELVPVYNRYRELGGKYVTLGSDAHTAENIGMNFDVARDMLSALKLEPVTFCERKMEYCR